MVRVSVFLVSFAVFGLLILPGCEPKVQETPEYLSLQQKSDSLLRQISAKEQDVANIAAIVNEIENNLAAIQKDQLSINSLKNSASGDAAQKDRINEMIAGIDNYMEQNRQRIEKLEAQARKGGSKAKALQELVVQLKASLEAKEIEITKLRANVDSLAGVNTGLKEQVVMRDAVITRKDSALAEKAKDILDRDTEMNKAYYIFGSRTRLVDAGAIDRKGNFLKKTSIVSSRIDKSKMTLVDIRKIDDINLGITEKKDVISAHPSDSYYIALVGEEAHLKISDPKKFWSATRCLVVEVDKED
jgi:chromosome segregation ATPase